MELKIYPDPILRQKATPVQEITNELVLQAMEMMKIMKDKNGIGLAAQQVGLLHRVLVMDTTHHDPISGTKAIMFNPEILSVSKERRKCAEGCLSLPGQRQVLCRPISVVVRYVDEYKKVQTKILVGISATCVLHEIDHLNAVLMLDIDEINNETYTIKK